ncbi:MAG: hypothetical protein ACD_2C00097G0014 [uncultured bacterium (gcode 4)]|uniref:N-acetyltransferase domain-containing protein n=1 Tax=uncultured bacterium (gcode 4) TaxID=1234023 RepID=K2FEZ7_9BACT|nr:MAG: hypothetical protein ACD_2C00097G0014 [uncultured bacterium (gcode 4)]
MDFVIREATLQDLKAIQDLNLALFKKEHEEFNETLDCSWTFSEEGEEYFKKHIAEDDCCVFLAQIDQKIVGYLAGGILDETEKFRKLPISAELENMFIIHECRNMGIGLKLYQSFAEWSKAKNAGMLRVVATAQNTPGIDFYRKNGFTDTVLVLERNI